MADGAADETPPQTQKACRQCAEPILASARLCRHCRSYQDWRGYLNLSSTVLALLVALVSVLSAALPGITAAFHTSTSRVVLSSPVVRGERLYLVASNLGDAPGLIERGSIHSRFLPVGTTLDVPADAAFIPPGANQIGLPIRLALNPDHVMGPLVRLALNNGTDHVATVMVWGRQSDGEAIRASFELTASDLSELVATHMDRCEETQPRNLSNGCGDIVDVNENVDRTVSELGGAVRPHARGSQASPAN